MYLLQDTLQGEHQLAHTTQQTLFRHCHVMPLILQQCCTESWHLIFIIYFRMTLHFEWHLIYIIYFIMTLHFEWIYICSCISNLIGFRYGEASKIFTDLFYIHKFWNIIQIRWFFVYISSAFSLAYAFFRMCAICLLNKI